MGLLIDNSEDYFKFGESEISDQEIENLIAVRNQAREKKDFSLADKIRKQLIEKGIVLEDLNGKTIWKKKS